MMKKIKMNHSNKAEEHVSQFKCNKQIRNKHNADIENLRILNKNVHRATGRFHYNAQMLFKIELSDQMLFAMVFLCLKHKIN